MSSPATSNKFNLSSWQCPHCEHWYPVKAEAAKISKGDGDGGNNGAASTPVFYRDTCRHDVCITCIAQVLSRVSKKVKREEAVAEGQPVLVTATCPIIIEHDRRWSQCSGGRTCQGKFHINVANIPFIVNNDDMVIDLCDDSDEVEESVVSTARASGITVKVKQEILEENALPSVQAIVPVKTEALQPEHELSTSGDNSISSTLSYSITQASLKPNTNFTNFSPLPVTNIGNLKPLFEVGADVYAAWWDPIKDKKRRSESQWYSGVMISYEETIHATSIYGRMRHYYIKYCDGDELDNIPDHFVWSKSDYELNEKLGKKLIGVRKRKDKTSNDEWAKKVGWSRQWVRMGRYSHF
jgi:hypothetical protein